MKAITPAPARKPGEVPAHRIPVFDHLGNTRGHVGHTASGATVSRLLGRHGASLGEKNGRQAWVGHKPPPPPKPTAEQAAAAQKPKNDAAQKPTKHSVEVTVKGAKSASKK